MFIVLGYLICKNDYVKFYLVDKEVQKNDRMVGRRTQEILVKGFPVRPEIINKVVKPVYNSRGHIQNVEVVN